MTDAEKVAAALREMECEHQACWIARAAEDGSIHCLQGHALADFVEAAQEMRQHAPHSRQSKYDAALAWLVEVME